MSAGGAETAPAAAPAAERTRRLLQAPVLPTDGRLRVRLRDGDREVAAGELLVVPRGAEHSAQALSREVHLLVLGPAAA